MLELWRLLSTFMLDSAVVITNVCGSLGGFACSGEVVGVSCILLVGKIFLFGTGNETSSGIGSSF